MMPKFDNISGSGEVLAGAVFLAWFTGKHIGTDRGVEWDDRYDWQAFFQQAGVGWGLLRLNWTGIREKQIVRWLGCFGHTWFLLNSLSY